MTNYMYLVVQYEKNYKDIPLLKAFQKNILDNSCKKIVVYDNSVKKSEIINQEFIHYYFSGHNSGTAGAYRYGINYAIKNRIQWIVLLDQDTLISNENIEQIDKIIKIQSEGTIGAFLPNVMQGERRVSPCTVNKFGGMDCKISSKVVPNIISGISSGAILNVRIFQEIINSIPVDLWLDYVDHWMYLQCQRMGFRIITTNINLQHNLSINNLSELSEIRIRSIINGEKIYCKELGKFAYYLWPIRIFYRTIKCSMSNKSYARKILKILTC